MNPNLRTKLNARFAFIQAELTILQEQLRGAKLHGSADHVSQARDAIRLSETTTHRGPQFVEAEE